MVNLTEHSEGMDSSRWFFTGRFLLNRSWRNAGMSEKTGCQKKRKNKLIDIGLRWVSLDIEQSYWTVISGHWMVL